MGKRTVIVKYKRIQYMCDVGNCPGEMMPTGRSRELDNSGEFQHLHRCNKCGRSAWLDNPYPRRLPDSETTVS